MFHDDARELQTCGSSGLWCCNACIGWPPGSCSPLGCRGWPSCCQRRLDEEDEGERNLEVRILQDGQYQECAEMEDQDIQLIYEQGRFTFQAWNILQHAQLQCVEVVEVQASLPWIENFDHQDGTKFDDGTTSWTTTWTAGAAAPSSGIFEVQKGKLKYNSAGFEGVLETTIIDIAGQTPVNVSLDLYSVGTLEATGNLMDYVRLYAKVDGGSELLLGEKLGNQPVGTSITGSITAGSQLKVIIKAKVTSIDEFYYMDNLRVFKPV